MYQHTSALIVIAFLCFIKRSFAVIAAVRRILSDCLHPPMRATATAHRAGLPVTPHTLTMNCERFENQTAISSHIIKGGILI